jgi:hypothetical protein
MDEIYVVCVTWPEDDEGEIALETYISKSSLEEAKARAEHWNFREKKARIAKLTFIEEGK